MRFVVACVGHAGMQAGFTQIWTSITHLQATVKGRCGISLRQVPLSQVGLVLYNGCHAEGALLDMRQDQYDVNSQTRTGAAAAAAAPV